MRCLLVASTILGLAGVAAVAQPASDDNLTFEVASVKSHVFGAPGSTGRTGIEEDAAQVRIENLPLRVLIAISYGLKSREQLSGPAWLDTATFDIVAKPPSGYKRGQLPALLRNLLIDRFKLSVHHETRPISGFALVVAKSGLKLHESTGPRTYHTGRPGLIEGNQFSIEQLAGTLGNLLGTRVLDQTGLSAIYDLKLEWTPEAPAQCVAGAEPASAADPGLSLFAALQEQLGLRLAP